MTLSRVDGGYVPGDTGHASFGAGRGGMAEFIALAKAQPGKITLGHGGVGATTHVVGELFQLRAGIKLNPVPYKGTGPAVADAVAGQIQTAISTMPAAVPNIQAGRLRGLGIAGKKRFICNSRRANDGRSGRQGRRR